jgi:hypothetical protein
MGGRLAGLWLILAGAMMIAGCGAPHFTYVADSGANTYFKVPYGWHKLSDSSIAAVITGGQATVTPSGIWAVGYDAAPAAAQSDVLSPAVRQPFAFAVVLKPSGTVRTALASGGLRDFFFPVSATARQSAALQGFKLTGFRLLHDSVLTPGQGVHGVRDTFDYRYPGGLVDTFDQVAFANADNSQIYVLLVHCLASCYSQHHREINTVMSSFTVRS